MDAIGKQHSFDYCMYMMLASYFGKSVCVSKIQEEKLFLYYRELKPQEQIDMEQQCIKLIEKELLKKLPEKVWGFQVEVHLRGNERSPETEIQIRFKNHILQLYTEYQKRSPELKYNMWMKRRPNYGQAK